MSRSSPARQMTLQAAQCLQSSYSRDTVCRYTLVNLKYKWLPSGAICHALPQHMCL